MKGVHGSGQRRNGAVAGRAQRLRRMAGGAEHRLAVGDHASIKALRIETARGQRRRVERCVQRELVLVVQAQNVQPVIALRIGVPDPAGGGLRGGLRAGGVAGAAIHFVGDRQHDVVGGDGLVAESRGDHSHQRIRILAPGVVVRRNRNAFGAEPVHGVATPAAGTLVRSKSMLCGVLLDPGHGPSEQAHVRRELRPVKRQGELARSFLCRWKNG